MRIPSISATREAVTSQLFRIASTRAISAALLAFGIGITALAARPALAQSATVGVQPTVGAIRLGVFIPVSSKVTSPVGKYFPGGGLDYTFQQSGNDRTQVSADYMERSSSGSDVRVIPITVSELNYSGVRGGGIRPYWAIGAGAYFVHVNVPNPNPNEVVGNNGVAQINHTSTVLGGFLALGLDFPANFFVDLRYHQVAEVSHVNTSGFELTGGYRF